LLLAWIVLTAGEFRHRTSVTTLLGQPRRMRVVPARLAAALTGCHQARRKPRPRHHDANRERSLAVGTESTRISPIRAQHTAPFPALGSATISAALRASRPELGSHTVSVS
jgi:hypothetical protein